MLRPVSLLLAPLLLALLAASAAGGSSELQNGGVDPAFECSWRELAMQYALELRPSLSGERAKAKQLHDALELTTLCNASFHHEQRSVSSTTTMDDRAFGTSIYVDSQHGNDSNVGTLSEPFATLEAAVSASRSPGHQRPIAVLLRAGTYFVKETIKLGVSDSELTIAAYKEEAVTVSGARPLRGLNWTASEFNPKVFVADLSEFDLPMGVPALQTLNGERATKARYPNANVEVDLFPKGYITDSTRWGPPIFDGKICDDMQLCGPSTTTTIPATDSWHGCYQNWTVGEGGACESYVDPPTSPWCSADFYLDRQFPEMHARHPSSVDEARLPNAPYKQAEGAVVHAWRPMHWYTWMFEVNGTVPGTKVDKWTIYANQNNVAGIAQLKTDTDQVKYLGSFESAEKCAAACNQSLASKCNTWTYHEKDFPDKNWAKGCYFRVGPADESVWDPTDMDSVTSAFGPHSSAGVLTFGRGGNQGGEGADTAGEWFIEGVLEELDAPTEFFFDNRSKTKLLYYFPDEEASASAVPPPEMVVPTLSVIIAFEGTQSSPVKNVTLSGLTFTQTRPTFLDPRGNPSGGDWALERQGSILLEGTEFCSIQDSTFVKMDSNAIFLSGYNQHTHILRNTFMWLGQNAVASWGKAEKNDGTKGEFPRYTTVDSNWVAEIGHYQKQSSFYFQAETAEATLTNNIGFNLPRAAINFNDGFGGGANVSRNLLFNTCRESSDHGAFNSWDRLPYLTLVRDGTPSTLPAMNYLVGNFIVANNAANGGCFDHDDGSSNYDMSYNFCVFGGHKSDWDGNRKSSHHNLHVYSKVYNPTCIEIGAQYLPPKGYGEGYHSNVCILADSGSDYMRITKGVAGVEGADGGCSDLKNSTIKRLFEDGLFAGNNTVYAPGASAVVRCADQQIEFTRFQELGYDVGSTLSGDMPSAKEIAAMAHRLLWDHDL